MDSARHIIGCHLTQETRVRNAFDYVASRILQSLVTGGAGGVPAVDPPVRFQQPRPLAGPAGGMRAPGGRAVQVDRAWCKRLKLIYEALSAGVCITVGAQTPNTSLLSISTCAPTAWCCPYTATP
jgi:hypothetical protein